MTSTAYFHDTKVLRRLHEGPLGAHIDLYADRLLKEGHCRQSGARCIRVIGDFSHWLTHKHLDVSAVNEQVVEQYQQHRTKSQSPLASDRPALYRLLEVLREANIISPKAKVEPGVLELIEQEFGQYLLHERGLKPDTVIRHRTPLRKFLQECCSKGVDSYPMLNGSDITHFVERHAYDQSPRSTQSLCWTIRGFTRFLLYRGYTSTDLASAVPHVRTWQLTTLPEVLSPKQVQQTLASCDQCCPIGKRDYAVLVLLARLGLRAKEIAMLTLDDIDWHSGRLTVQGKGRKQASLPLLTEVGNALANYLQHGRPQTDSRHVFIRLLAPHRGLSSSGISMIAVSALTHADVEVRRKGSHIFRYSLATELLRAGASLMEIGQVLRHQHHDSTRIYAKVDICALRALGRPWPGGCV